MTILLAVILVLIVIAAIFFVTAYNRLVRLRNSSENAWAQVDVQLKRRYDLIPNLVETVKGYAAHERETFDEVTRARAAAQSAQGPAQQAQAENFLTQALGRLIAVSEAYPQLRATENFQQLQSQLTDTEDQIQTVRAAYNDSVLAYDNALQTIPTSIIAGWFGFTPREYFKVDDAATREAPKVSFDTPPAVDRAPPAAPAAPDAPAAAGPSDPPDTGTPA
jgi:LemA protein